MAEECILLLGLSADAEREMANHARGVGVGAVASASMPDGTALKADLVIVSASDEDALRRFALQAERVVAVGAALNADAQARLLDAGAADVIDLTWAPSLIGLRLVHLLERFRLHQRMSFELASKQRELADARALQLALVPRPDSGGALAVEVVLEPAMELGGDLVDYIVLADGRHVLALGDVSGKGAAAALTMARTHTLLRSLALRTYADELLSPPNTAAHRLNGMLAIENESCMFVTMFLGLFDPATGDLAYVRCGQIPPFLRRQDGSVERLDAVGGPPLGVVEDIFYNVGHATIGPGEKLLIVSDGVTEAEDANGALLGEEPVTNWLEQGIGELASLVALTRSHEAGRPPSDDLAALLIRRVDA